MVNLITRQPSRRPTCPSSRVPAKPKWYDSLSRDSYILDHIRRSISRRCDLQRDRKIPRHSYGHHHHLSDKCSRFNIILLLAVWYEVINLPFTDMDILVCYRWVTRFSADTGLNAHANPQWCRHIRRIFFHHVSISTEFFPTSKHVLVWHGVVF